MMLKMSVSADFPKTQTRFTRPVAFLAASSAATIAIAMVAAVAAAAPSHGRIYHHGKLATTPGQVVVPRGEPVQIAVVLDKSTSTGAAFTPGIRNAIQMAVQLSPAIRGFPIRVNGNFDGPCGTATEVVGQNADAATAVVANPQNVAVIGHMCSYPFGAATPDGCPSSGTTALSIYQSHGIVTINGSTTASCLPSVGPTVLNGTAVPGDGFDAWYAIVKTLPRDELWGALYQFEFGIAPTGFADLYFDATRLLLARIRHVSRIVNGSLVIDRAALARAVRNTANFPGVTCTVTLDAAGYRVNDPAALASCAL